MTEKVSKRRLEFSTRGHHETRIAKRGKILKENYRFKHELKMTFFLIFTRNRGGCNAREKRWGKQSYLATSREDIREAHAILAS